MKKRKVIAIVFLFIFCVVINGCYGNYKEGAIENMKTDESRYTELGEKIVTKEFLMNTYGFNESDLEGIDVEEVLFRFEVTEEGLQDTDSDRIIEYLQKMQKMMTETEEVKEASTTDYSYLVQTEEYTGEIPDYGSLKYMTFLLTEGNGGSSCFIDFHEKMIYYGHGALGVYKNIKNSGKSIKLTVEMESNILDSIRDANIQDWDYRYEVKTDNPEGNSEWHFGMEFEEGSVITFKGLNKAPITFFDISEVIYSYMP